MPTIMSGHVLLIHRLCEINFEDCFGHEARKFSQNHLSDAKLARVFQLLPSRTGPLSLADCVANNTKMINVDLRCVFSRIFINL